MKKFLIMILALQGGYFASEAMADDQQIANIQKVLKQVMPRGAPDAIAESMIPGLYEAIFGAQVIYMTADGKYMVEGDIYDIANRQNLTEAKREGGRVKAISAIDQDSLIVFTPKDGNVKHIITAFTDIDCGYCRKLHREMAKYNELGIEIRYAAFPRAGVGSDSYKKALSVWCAKNTHKAMNFAKNGAKVDQLSKLEQVKGKSCKEPISQHLSVAREVGVTGTPTLVMQNGQVLPGYVPAERLIKMLMQDKKS